MTASSATDPTRWAPAWVLSYVLLWPWPALAEAVLSLGALAALATWLVPRWRGNWLLLSPEARALTTLLFLSYWVPELLSVLDADNWQRGLREVATDLRYLPFLWLVALAVATGEGRRQVGRGLACIVAFWMLDAGVQSLTGFSLRGEVGADRLSGIFGADNLKLGPVLASLSPFLLLWLPQRAGAAAWLLSAAALGYVVLLAGARSAWLVYLLVLACSGVQRLGWRRALLGLLVGGAMALASALAFSDLLEQRMQRSAALLRGDWAGVNYALADRLPIWRAALEMSLEHPVNGVGVRGFRDAYPQYAQADDKHIREEGSAFHAHHWLLEVLSETGVLGLLLWLAGIAMALRAWRVATAAARERARAPALALAATLFPLNTHLAFYSTFWGGLILLLVALYAGSLLAEEPAPTPAAA